LKTPKNNEKLRRFFFLDLYNLRIKLRPVRLLNSRTIFLLSPFMLEEEEEKLEDKEARRFANIAI
jgi:hypothetical protein